MEWLVNLFSGSGVAHSVFIVAIVIAIGLGLNRIKFGSVSLGVTWILFVGIVAGHFGFLLDPTTSHFVKEFGLILFIYSIGLEVGPGFFSSFRKGGVTLNMLAAGIVLLGCCTAYAIHLITGTDLISMIGVLSGAVTNTPGMGAAQQTFYDMTGQTNTTIAQGYAVAYPLGVVGIILSIIVLKRIFRVNFDNERRIMMERNKENAEQLDAVTLEVHNDSVCGHTIREIQEVFGRKCVITRVLHEQTHDIELAESNTTLGMGDKIFLVAAPLEIEALTLLIGPRIDMNMAEWDAIEANNLTAERFVITNPAINGKRLGDLKLRQTFNVTISRISRAGVDLIAEPHLLLQLGDRVVVVGKPKSIEKISRLMGNSVKRLEEPNLAAIFLGIALGVVLGSLPIFIPNVPVPVKLGLAGGPLIVSILISKFGPQLKLVTYTTSSANKMIRQIGITLFLASVGIGAGDGFIDTIMNGGYWWILYGFLITVIPCLIIGVLARMKCKLSYFTIAGLISGAMTDPPALAYSNEICGNNQASVAYSTVYPLTMFLRVVTAQILVLMAL